MIAVITYSVIFLSVWCCVGHSFPIEVLMSNVVIIPLFLLFMFEFVNQNLSSQKVVATSLAILLLNDLQFRIYGGGDYDQLGRVLCDNSFFVTFIISAIVVLVILSDYKEKISIFSLSLSLIHI